jgi:hypothetical protein
MRGRIVFGLILVVPLAGPASADEPAGRLSFDPPDGRWQLLHESVRAVYQLLHESVRAVYQGPDDRLWYQLNGDSLGRSESQIRQSLAAEYRQPSPRISGAALALLEPSGRAWFYVNQAREVWGYDGQKWIERRASSGNYFFARCPTAGELPDNLANRSAGGKAWLRDLQGVHVFDGQSWSYSAICPRIPSIIGQLRYAVSPSGKYAVALPPKQIQIPTGYQNVALWSFADGKWQQVDSPWTNRPTTVGSFCVTDKGVLWYVAAGMLHSVSIDRSPPERADQQLAELIRRLDADEFDKRQQAHDALAGREDDIRPQLKAAQGGTQSAEMKWRLEALLKLHEAKRTNPALRLLPGATKTIGQCRVQSVKSIFQDDAGRLYIFAERITPANQAPLSGLAIVDGEEKTAVYPLENQNEGLTSFPFSVRGPILTPRRDALWLSSSTFPGPVRRIHLASNQVDDGAPDLHFGEIHAVEDRRRVFIGSEPHFMATARSSVALLRPDRPDLRPSLTARTEPIGWPAFVVADDGAVWAMRKDEGLSRFDGDEWKAVYKAGEHVSPTLAGQGNVVLAQHRGGYALFRNDRFVASGPLRELIKNHRDIFAAAFPPDFTPQQRQLRICIATDRGGHVWLVERQRLAVLVDGRWLEVEDSLKAAGSRDGSVQFVSTVGDGSKVYLSDFGLAHLKGKSFLAEIEGGKLVVSAAPHATSSAYLGLGLRDRSGTLWLPSQKMEPRGGATTQVTGHQTLRLGDGGLLGEPIDGMWPLLIDRAGNVWLSELKSGRPSNRFSLWRDGQVVQQLDVPGILRAHGLFADRAGSVYVWTTLGLQHLVSEKADAAGAFRLASTYALHLPAPAGEPVHSPLAGLVVSVRVGPQLQLCIFQLPNE